MNQLALEKSTFITESAQEVRLVNVRVVTKAKKLTAAEKRAVEACDRVMSDPANKWHDWNDVRKQLGL